MDKETGELKIISVYWWNMNHKTKDFEGTYKDYLKKRGITVTPVMLDTTAGQVKAWRCRIPLSSSTTQHNILTTDYVQACDDAIRIFLILMGDKSTYINGYGRTYTINH